ncbi:MAG TPA: cytochrome c3 family protein [Geobacteraceae bacterium]
MKPTIAPFLLILALSAVPSAFAETCITATCHPAIGGLKNLHQPVKDGDCLVCHVQKAKEHPIKGGKSFTLTSKVPELCSQCHDAMGKKNVVHAPVKDGDCLACHKPHGAANRYLLDVGEDQTELCLGCHDGAPFKQKFQHGPVAVGACTSCHSPHESAEKSLLKGVSRELCLKCHTDFAKALQAAARVHAPVQTKPCTSCHNPHSSAAPYVLKQKMPELCIGCHVGIGEKLAKAKVVHKPLLESRGCGTCHSTHFANTKALLAGDEKSVCLGCHSTDTLGNPPLKNMKKELDGKKNLHGPIQKNQCTGCHDPHGTDYPRLFPGSYPESFYLPYKDGSYDLCLKCHDRNLLRYPDTTIYTKFRNGNQNLHYLHVVDRRKGRSCRACHVPHGGDGQKLISKDGATFGDWKIPTRFEITPTGGSCTPGCHRSVKYDRVNPASNEPVVKTPESGQKKSEEER